MNLMGAAILFQKPQISEVTGLKRKQVLRSLIAAGKIRQVSREAFRESVKAKRDSICTDKEMNT